MHETTASWHDGRNGSFEEIMKTARELDIPIRKWVPDKIGIIIVFLIMLPIAMLNGTYTGSMVEVSNTLGVYTEDITIGYYAASAGMAISYPIVPKILNTFSSKTMLLADLSLQFLLSWACANMTNIDLLIAFSFVIGFLKGFLMLWVIRRIKFIFSPNDVRSEFYAYFYPIVFGSGQISMVVTALLAYHYEWKHMYYFMMIMLMTAILAVILFLRHDRPHKPIPWKELHGREMLIIATSLIMLIYLITYGKVLDWMASSRICIYIVIAPLLLSLFLWEQFHSSQPYVSLKPLFQWKTILGYFYMMLVMFFSTSTSLMTSYLTTILKVDSTRSYTLYIWSLPGYIVGAIICFWWFRWQRWRFRFLVAGGMLCFAFFFGSLYFTVSPSSTYEMLFLPIFMRGLGMMVLIIAFALFAVEDLSPKYLLSNAFFLISFRSVLTPVLASAFYNNMLYRLQQKYIVEISDYMTSVNPLAMERYSSSFNSNIMQGHSFDEAVQIATNSIYTTAQQQATLLALKDLFGWLFLITLIIAIISRFIPFHKAIKVPVIHTGEDMV